MFRSIYEDNQSLPNDADLKSKCKIFNIGIDCIHISLYHELTNPTEEKCQKSGKKYGVVCCPCRSTFVASLLKNSLLLDLKLISKAVLEVEQPAVV